MYIGFLRVDYCVMKYKMVATPFHIYEFENATI